MLAYSHIGNGGVVKMVNFAYFGETYTYNVWIHKVNYTVSEIEAAISGLNHRAEPKSCLKTCVFPV